MSIKVQEEEEKEHSQSVKFLMFCDCSIFQVHTESINGVDKRSLETDKRSLKTQEELEKLKEIVKIL